MFDAFSNIPGIRTAKNLYRSDETSFFTSIKDTKDLTRNELKFNEVKFKALDLFKMSYNSYKNKKSAKKLDENIKQTALKKLYRYPEDTQKDPKYFLTENSIVMPIFASPKDSYCELFPLGKTKKIPEELIAENEALIQSFDFAIAKIDSISDSEMANEINNLAVIKEKDLNLPLPTLLKNSIRTKNQTFFYALVRHVEGLVRETVVQLLQQLFNGNEKQNVGELSFGPNTWRNTINPVFKYIFQQFHIAVGYTTELDTSILNIWQKQVLLTYCIFKATDPIPSAASGLFAFNFDPKKEGVVVGLEDISCLQRSCIKITQTLRTGPKN